MDKGQFQPAKESPVGVFSSWAALVASFLLSFATWVELANLAGFDQHWSFFGATIWLSWAMGVAVDGYVVTSLVAWMAPVSEKIARFAKWNTYGGALISVAAQSVFHGLTTYTIVPVQDRVWRAWLAAGVGALPPLAGALSVHLRALVRQSALSAAAKSVEDASVPTLGMAPVDVVPVSPAIVPVPRPPVMSPRPEVTRPPARPVSPAPSRTVVTSPVSPVPSPRPPVPAPGPGPMRPRPVNAPVSPGQPPAWGDTVAAMLQDGASVRDIMAALPGTWNTYEGAKKAIQRYRKTMIAAGTLPA